MARDVRKFRDSSIGRTIARHRAKKNLRSDAHADAAEAHEEKIDCGEVTDAKADRIAGEIAIAEEKISGDSDPIFEYFGFGEEKEIVAEPHSAIFVQSVEQEKETQEFGDTDSVAIA